MRSSPTPWFPQLSDVNAAHQRFADPRPFQVHHIDESPPGIEDAVHRTDTLFPR